MKTAIVVKPVENLLKLLPVSENDDFSDWTLCENVLELQAMLTNPLCLWDINDFASYFLRFSFVLFCFLW